MFTVDAEPATRTARTVRARSVLLLVALGFVLRVWGATFGLPYAYHVDESLFSLVTRTAFDSGFTQLAPNFSAFQLLIAIEHWLFGFVEPLVRLLPMSREVIATLDAPVERYNLIARIHSLTLGSLTAIPVYLLGRRLWNPQVGLLAAAFMTTCYLHVRNSHFGVPETTVTFFVVVAAYCCSSLYLGAPFRRYVLAGAFCGLAVASKQLAWPIFVLLFLFHAFAPLPEGAPQRARLWLARLFHPKFVTASLVGVATYLVCVPQMVLKWPEFYAYWRHARNVGARGGMDRFVIDDAGRFGTYVYSLRWGMGDVLFLLALAGVAVALIRPASPRVRLLYAFPVLYFAFLLLPGQMYMSRYTMSAIPFLLLAAAALVCTILSRVPLTGWAYRAAVAALIALAIGQPVVASVRFNRLLTKVDTRTLAKAWIEQNIPEGSTIMLEFLWFSPPLASEQQRVPFSTRQYTVLTRGAYGLSDYSNTFGPSQGTPTVAEYATLGVDYIVSNSYSRGSKLLDPEEDRAKRSFYDELDRDAELVKEFSPYRPNAHVPRLFAETYGPAIHLSRYERPGPVIRIHRLRKTALLP